MSNSKNCVQDYMNGNKKELLTMIECFKTKYTWHDVEPGDKFPSDDAKIFIERIKSRLIGKELKQILVNSFYHCGKTYNETETFIEWAQKNSPTHIEWDDPLILCIGDEQLEISLWQPDRYALSLNVVNVEEIIDTNEVSLSSIFEKEYHQNSPTFYDISACYKEKLIGQKIKNIELITGRYEEDDTPLDEYFDKIVITLENGVVFNILVDIDSPTIEIVERG